MKISTDLVELHWAKDVDPFRKQLVDVAQQIGIHGSAAGKQQVTSLLLFLF